MIGPPPPATRELCCHCERAVSICGVQLHIIDQQLATLLVSECEVLHLWRDDWMRTL